MGLSGSFLAPGRRLERTSSDTGNNAEINKVMFKLLVRRSKSEIDNRFS